MQKQWKLSVGLLALDLDHIRSHSHRESISSSSSSSIFFIKTTFGQVGRPPGWQHPNAESQHSHAPPFLFLSTWLLIFLSSSLRHLRLHDKPRRGRLRSARCCCFSL